MGLDLLELDSLSNSSTEAGDDLIDDFWSGNLWRYGLPGRPILVGRIQQEAKPAPGQEPVSKRSLYNVRLLTGEVIPDCILLSSLAYGSFTKNRFSPDAVPGQQSKPYAGSLCVVATGPGATAFILGFFNPPTTIQTESDNNTSETNPGSVEDAEARSPGDWIVRTEDAAINVKRMGAIVIQSGASIRVTMNPLDGVHFSQAKTRISIAEGYRSQRGRIENEKPEALSTDEYLDKILQRGRTSIRVRVRNGQVDSTTRRELTVSEVNFATPTKPIETNLARERFFDDGSWIAEGPKYQWGGSGADEPIVLGNALVDVIKELSRIVKQLKVGTAWGPSTAPLPPTPVDLQTLENNLDKILSDYMFSTKTPAAPGTF